MTILLLQLIIVLSVFINICIFRRYLRSHKPSNKNLAPVKKQKVMSTATLNK